MQDEHKQKGKQAAFSCAELHTGQGRHRQGVSVHSSTAAPDGMMLRVHVSDDAALLASEQRLLRAHSNVCVPGLRSL